MVAMSGNSIRKLAVAVLISGLAAVLLLAPPSTFADKKKKEAPKPKPTWLESFDTSRIVWPNPPAVTRVRYMSMFTGETLEPPTAAKKKASWKDRLAGSDPDLNPNNPNGKKRFALGAPYGVAVDSKNRLYVADTKVGAIFVFSAETHDVEMIRNGHEARFVRISGLAIDDSDRIFVSDNGLAHVLVIGANRKVEAAIAEGMKDPAGIAIDNENRFLYVCDTELDQVLVYDADNFKLLRKIGTAGKAHTLTTSGDFAKPTNAAVDSDGNLYVTDTLNNRVEVFDADGKFSHEFGKAGDGPGYFARPKGIAIDSDGHIWVADAFQDRVQLFNREGRLLMWIGGHGQLPGQFMALAGIAIDKNNRVFTSEQYPGRVQMFRYITTDEAMAEQEKRDAAQKKSTEAKVQPTEVKK
jgi:DNA-binding beta-propeller fold protein YncE